MQFVPGRLYRRASLHDQYGGNRQRGISIPAAQRSFAFLFTGPGARYGYHDRQVDTDTFEYSGEGPTGDMEFAAGNKALAELSLDLHLFEAIGSGQVKYLGLFRSAGHRIVRTPDREHRDRQAIVFRLKRVVED